MKTSTKWSTEESTRDNGIRIEAADVEDVLHATVEGKENDGAMTMRKIVNE